MLYKLSNLLYIFIITAFLGWLMETVGSGFIYNRYVSRGSINFPVCIIYGFAIIFMYLLLKTPHEGFWIKLRRKINNKVLGWTLTIILYFVFVFAISFLLEYSTGYFIDKLNLEKQWDYSGYKDNINGYVRWTFLLFFGLGGTFYMLFAFPFIYRQANYSNHLSIRITNYIFISFIIFEYFFI